MAVSRGLWVPLDGATGTVPVEARLADAGLFAENAPGVPRSGLLGAPSIIVTGTGTMNYSVNPCKPVCARTVGEGVYRWSIDGATTVPTTDAPGSNSRIDIIWTKQNDQTKGDANNLAVLGCSQGVASPTPSPPVIPEGAVELARATVGALITGTSQASITQTYAHTALRGTPIPVRNVTERGTITNAPQGTKVLRLDTASQDIEEWVTGAWRNTAQSRGITHKTQFATGPDSGPQTAEVVLMSIDNVTFKAGRHYRITIEQNYYTSNTDTVMLEKICLAPAGEPAGLITNLTRLREVAFKAGSSNRAFPADLSIVYSPTADTTRQVKITCVRVEGTGNWQIQRSATTPAVLTVTDEGLQ